MGGVALSRSNQTIILTPPGIFRAFELVTCWGNCEFEAGCFYGLTGGIPPWVFRGLGIEEVSKDSRDFAVQTNYLRIRPSYATNCFSFF